MKLPEMRHDGAAAQRQEIEFGGLDLTDGARAGEVSWCKNLSARRYPLLAPRRGREVTARFENPQAAFRWDGRLIVAANGVLSCDGQAVDNVSPGGKQFAVVGTKLIVWPDKAYLDLTNGTFGHLDAGVETAAVAGGVTITADSLTAQLTPRLAADVWAGAWQGKPEEWNPTLYTYENDPAALRACWVNGAWDAAALNKKKVLTGILGRSGTGTPGAALREGDLFLPEVRENSYAMVTGCIRRDEGQEEAQEEAPEEARQSAAGWYCAVTRIEMEGSLDGNYVSVWFDVYKADVETALFSGVLKAGDAVDVTGTPWAIDDAERAVITALDDAGNKVSFATDTFRAPAYVHRLDAALEAGTQYRLRIAVEEPAPEPEEGEEPEAPGAPGLESVTVIDYYDYQFTPAQAVPAGSVLCLSGSGPTEKICVWRVGNRVETECSRQGVTAEADGAAFLAAVNTAGEHRFTYDGENWTYRGAAVVLNTYGITLTGEPEAGCVITVRQTLRGAVGETWENVGRGGMYGAGLNAKAYDPGESPLTVRRAVPDLDYICESRNRLWGVCNRRRTFTFNEKTGRLETADARVICASALGDPAAWWTFEGLATDSWQLAVGSEGDFTAVCSWDGGVCCWKEERLHRVLGSTPEEFTLTEQQLEGVQAGSRRSLAEINGTLYYKGTEGVWAWRGGTPALISAKLGGRRWSGAAAGSDGRRYCISMENEAGTYDLLTYDTMRGLWLREDETQAIDFCRADGALYLLRQDGALLRLETESDRDTETDEAVTWSAELAPFRERDAHERKNYLRILLRLEIGRGGSATVKVQRGGTWEEIGTITREGQSTAVVPVWPNRVDDLRLRLSGTAPCAVLSLAREYTEGSIL